MADLLRPVWVANEKGLANIETGATIEKSGDKSSNKSVLKTHFGWSNGYDGITAAVLDNTIEEIKTAMKKQGILLEI